MDFAKAIRRTAREAHDRLQRHFAGETPGYACELRMRHKDGHWVWVMARGRVFTRSADGKPGWMFGTHLDISERKATETRLADREALLSITLRARSANASTDHGRTGPE